MMRNICLKKALVVGIIVLFIGSATAPIINGLTFQTSNIHDNATVFVNKNEGNINSDLPDIKTKRISAGYIPLKPIFVLTCNVKNIGAVLPDYWFISVDIVAELYNSTSKTYNKYDTFGCGSGSSEPLKTGEWMSCQFSYDNYFYFHPIGIIKFKCNATLSHPKGEKESNYKNNHLTHIFYHPKATTWIPLIKKKNLGTPLTDYFILSDLCPK